MQTADLKHGVAEIVQQALINIGAGSDPDLDPLAGWPVYHDGSPDSPDEMVTVRETAGVGAGRAMVSGVPAEHHGVQVRVRGRTYSSAKARANLIRTLLNETAYQTHVALGANQYLVHCFSAVSGVLPIGEDSKGEPGSARSVFTINALCPIRKLS